MASTAATATGSPSPSCTALLTGSSYRTGRTALSAHRCVQLLGHRGGGHGSGLMGEVTWWPGQLRVAFSAARSTAVLHADSSSAAQPEVERIAGHSVLVLQASRRPPAKAAMLH